MRQMVQWASAPFDERYDQVYFNLALDEIRTVANAGQATVAYCTFSKPFVTNVELHDDIDLEAGMQAILKAPAIENYLNFVGGKSLTVEFYGQSDVDEIRAEKIVLDGDLRAEVYLPSSEADYSDKALKVVQVYDEDDNWRRGGGDGDTLATSFETHTSEFQKIIDVVNFDDFALSNYPVVVEDGDFLLSASDDNERDSVRGQLEADNVEGPDVSKSYSRGFEELFSTIDGEIDVGVGAEEGGPITIVRAGNDDSFTLRYSILPAT